MPDSLVLRVPALVQANLEIVVGSGTDITAETANIILGNSKPTDITNRVESGKATYRKMIQSLFWTTSYDVIALPLAVGVLCPHFMFSRAMSAVLNEREYGGGPECASAAPRAEVGGNPHRLFG